MAYCTHTSDSDMEGQPGPKLDLGVWIQSFPSPRWIADHS